MGPGCARTVVVLFAALALASLSARARAADYPFEAQPDTSGILAYYTDNNGLLAQSILPTATYRLTTVSAYVADMGNPNVLTVRIVSDAGGVPSGTTVLGAATNASGAAFVWTNFSFNPPVNLAAGTTYWIVADSPGGNGQGYAWRYVSANAYPRGTAATQSGVWTIRPGDFAFFVYGRTPASVALSVVADRAEARSGDALAYAITLANTGMENATDLWVNATLDARLTLTSASGPAVITVTGPLVSARLPALSPGNATVTIAAVAGPLFGNGSFISLPVTAEFTDGGGRGSAAADAPVRVRAPSIVATLVYADTAIRPGDLLTFEVIVDNTGSEIARHAWLNESLHPSLTFLDASLPPEQTAGEQSWHLLDLAPGRTTFNVTVQVDPRTADETVVANFLSIAFTDSFGDGLVRGKSNTVFARVVPLLPGGGSDPWLWGSFAISATVVGGTYLVLARRRLRTEEIFLIHHSGVLLVHMSKSLKADHDSDILSGMFTAIMNFVHDAFHYEMRQELHGLDLGGYRVHVSKGAMTYLALVHSGKTTRWLQTSAARAVADVERLYGELLKDWSGDVRGLSGVREILKGYFLSPTGPSRSMHSLRAWFSRFDQTFKGMRPL